MLQTQKIPVWVKIANLLILVICYTPLLYLLAFYSYILRVVITIGGIPSHHRLIPEGVSFGKHRVVIDYSLIITLYGVFAFLFLLLLTAPKKEFYVKRIHYSLYVFGIIGMFLHFRFDPLFAWYLD